jgi:tRNA(Arg) A34 adenosine deaminase TadA
VLADSEGKLLRSRATATRARAATRTAHAERVLTSRAARANDLALLAKCTLYTSAEPYAMCAGDRPRCLRPDRKGAEG